MTYATDTLGRAFKKTKKLFFPIRRGYWLRMGFVNLFGGRSNSFSMGSQGRTSRPTEADFDMSAFISDYGAFIGVFFFVICAISLFFTYINSVFTFMFIDGLVKEDIKIKKSFKKNHGLGLSIFMVRLILGASALLIGVVIFSPLIMALLYGNLSTFNYLLLVPMLAMLFVLMFIFFLLWFLIYEFVMPIMYLKKYNFMKAWRHFTNKAAKRKAEIGLYWLIRTGISIATNIAVLILSIPILIVMIVLLIPFILIGASIYLLTAMSSLSAAMIITGAYGLIIFLLVVYTFSVIYVPVAGFFRLWSIEMVKKLRLD